MKMLLINPYLKMISQMKWTAEWNYKEIYNLIDCTMFDWVTLDNRGNGFFCDDEGLLTADKDTRYFTVLKADGTDFVTIAGSALVLGTDDKGDTVSTTLSTHNVNKMIKFHNKEFTYEPELPMFIPKSKYSHIK